MYMSVALNLRLFIFIKEIRFTQIKRNMKLVSWFTLRFFGH